jgi:hypothetical protein
VAATKKSPDPDALVGARDVQRLRGLFVACFAVALLVLATVAAYRGVNADEGFYLAASWRVLSGQRLYADFFFPQMPYLPLLQAGVLSVSGAGLGAGRMISVVGGALLTGILAVAAARATGNRSAGAAVAAAYLGHALVLKYVSIGKPYGLADLASVGAFVLLAGPRVGIPRGILAGIGAAVAVGTRLPTLAVTPVLLWLAARRDRRTLGAFVRGAAVASTLCLWAATQDPGNFWFGNVGFHALRREISGVAPVLLQKGAVLLKWVLWPQNLVLCALAATGLALRRQAAPAVAAAAVMAMVYLTATPTYLEYFVQVVPFLLLAAAPAIDAGLRRRTRAAVLAAVYAVALVVALRSPPDASPRGAKAQMWRRTTVDAVVDYLRANSGENDRILSWWQGYPILAQRQGFDGVGFWESNVAKKLAADERRRVHVMGREELVRLVRDAEPALIVFAEGTWQEVRVAARERYRLATTFGSIQILERRGADSVPGAR